MRAFVCGCLAALFLTGCDISCPDGNYKRNGRCVLAGVDASTPSIEPEAAGAESPTAGAESGGAKATAGSGGRRPAPTGGIEAGHGGTQAEGGRGGNPAGKGGTGGGATGAGQGGTTEAGQGGTEAGQGGTEDAAGQGGVGGTQAGAGGSPEGPICGDGVKNGAEICDGDCPKDCSMPASCMTASLKGSPEECTAECVIDKITACSSGDGCCPEGCVNATDSDCSKSCGDGTVDAPEKCEPMSKDRPCPRTASDCGPAKECTQNVVTGSADQCSAECTSVPITKPADGDGCCPSGANASNDDDCETKCGDGVVTGNETCDTKSSSKPCPTSCDDGKACTKDSPKGSACTAACEYTPITSAANGDGCCPNGATAATDNDCMPSCGDGAVSQGEECDPLAPGWTGLCDSKTCKRNRFTACNSESMCGGLNCVVEVCTTSCFDDSDCVTPPGIGPAACWPIIAGEISRCVLPCSADSQCPSGLVCRNFLHVVRGQPPITWQFCSTSTAPDAL